MEAIERFADLTSYTKQDAWRDRIFQLGKELGYEQTLLAIFPNRNSPIEARHAFLHSNYSPQWRNKYDEEKMGRVDPTVSHCVMKSTPLIWTPNIFSAHKQKEMYEEACHHGIRSGVTLPIHGANGELGVLCFVTDTQPDKYFERDAIHNIPALSYFRDFILETSLQFMKKPVRGRKSTKLTLTPREIECIKWSATGKSSWDISQILNCTEAAVNFHFMNIRRKFGTSSRRQAVVKALHQGIIKGI